MDEAAVGLIQSVKNSTPKSKKPHAKGKTHSNNGLAKGHDKVSLKLDEVYKSLTLVGQEVIKKLNEVLGKDLPGGVQSLKPEEHTPEATAARIVSGVTGFLPIFEQQNPDLKGAELINAFMKEIKKGISEGHKQAMAILGDIGALKFDGVESGIEETMRLVDEKLAKFAEQFLAGTETPEKEGPKVEVVPFEEPTTEPLSE